jgi:hypothetical protein
MQWSAARRAALALGLLAALGAAGAPAVAQSPGAPSTPPPVLEPSPGGSPAPSPEASPPPSPEASPLPIEETVDPRSEGAGPGLVGSPFGVLLGVLGLGVLTAAATAVFVRLTRGAAASGNDDPEGPGRGDPGAPRTGGGRG